MFSVPLSPKPGHAAASESDSAPLDHVPDWGNNVWGESALSAKVDNVHLYAEDGGKRRDPKTGNFGGQRSRESVEQVDRIRDRRHRSGTEAMSASAFSFVGNKPNRRRDDVGADMSASAFSFSGNSTTADFLGGTTLKGEEANMGSFSFSQPSASMSSSPMGRTSQSALARYNRLKSHMNKINLRQSHLLKRRATITEQLLTYQIQLCEMFTAQSTALEKEEYSLADNLAARIVRWNAMITKLKDADLAEIDKTLNDLSERESGLLTELSISAEEAEDEMHDLFEQREQAQRQIIERERSNANTQGDKCEGGKFEFDEKKGKIRKENEQYIAMEKDVLLLFEEENRELLDERKSALNDSQQIKEKISELVNTLSALRRSEADVAFRLQQVDAKLIEAERRYEPERRKIESARATREQNNRQLAHLEESIAAATQLYAAQCERLQALEKAYEQTTNEHAEKLRELRNEAMMTSTDNRPIDSFWKTRQIKETERRQFENEFELAESEYAAAQTDIQQHSSDLLVMRKELANAMHKKVVIEEELPSLEERKALTVAVRNFKQAGEIAERQVDLQEKLKRINRNVERMKELVIAKEGTVTQAKNRTELLGKALDVKRADIGARVLESVENATAAIDLQLEDPDLRSYAHLTECLLMEKRSLTALRTFVVARYQLDIGHQNDLDSLPQEKNHGDVANTNGNTADAGSQEDKTIDHGLASPDVSHDNEAELFAKTGAKLNTLEQQLKKAIEVEDFGAAEKIEEDIKKWKAVLKKGTI